MNDFFKENKKIIQKNKKLFSVLVGIAAVGLIAYILSGHASNTNKEKSEKIPDLTGVVTTDFTAHDNKSALTQQQTEMDELKKSVELMKDQIEAQKTISENQSKKSEETITSLKEQIVQANKQKVVQQKIAAQQIVNEKQVSDGIKVFQVNSTDTKKKTTENFVPSGTFAAGVITSGVDADAGTSGSGNTKQVHIKLLDNATLPNRKHSTLKGCFVLGSAYGDLSSERAEIRLVSLSCVRNDGTIIDTNVEGFASFHGREGIRGQVVLPNKEILRNGFIGGFASGLGESAQNSMLNVSTNDVTGSNSYSVDPSQSLEYGALGGFAKGSSKIGDYWSKLADQYHPVIDIGAGTPLTVVFQRGFYLDDSLNSKKSHKDTDQGIHETTVSMNMGPSLEQATKQIAAQSSPQMQQYFKQAEQQK